MEIITRAEAKAQGLLRYFTGKPCKRGHVTERQTSDCKCIGCDREWQHAWYDRTGKDYGREWAQNNRAVWNAQVSARKALQIQATPAWADPVAIAAVYAEADRLTRETGIPHEVDHIVPLRSRLVCGLHVETNLRAITASENREKGNRWRSE